MLNKSITYNAITNDISVSVVSTFEPDHSEILEKYFVFSYEVQVKNLSEHAVQLLRREWWITDLLNGKNYVEGEGVIGQTPVIQPNESYSYSSWCPITSSIGYMEGFYEFVDLVTKGQFKVEVPRFDLFAGYKKN